MATAPFPFVEVSGPAYERGRSYGAAIPARIRRSAEIYGGQLAELGFDAAASTRLIAGFVPLIDGFGPHYVEEMRGIADGSGVPFEQIVMINARTEIVARARLLAGRPEAETAPTDKDGCTGAIILPERTAAGRLIHGQNWDWRAECAETAIVLCIRQADGPDMLTFVEAGGLARCGMNAAGIAITANYLESDRDYRHEGVPLALIRRKVLEQEHVALAMRAVATTPKACSNNMMLSHRDGWAIDFECAPDEAFPVLPDRGMIVHANHWTSPVALAKLKETGIPSVPESYYRDWRVRRSLEAAGDALRPANLKSALFDDWGTPYSVCRPARPSLAGNLSATVAMVVMEPALGVMEVAPLPAQNRVFTRYAFAADPVTLAAAE